LPLFPWFTSIRALFADSTIIVTIAGLCTTAGFRNNYAWIKWSSVSHICVS